MHASPSTRPIEDPDGRGCSTPSVSSRVVNLLSCMLTCILPSFQADDEDGDDGLDDDW